MTPTVTPVKTLPRTDVGSVEWHAEPIRNFARIGTGAKDTQNRNPDGQYPFFVRSQKVERIDSWSFDGEAILTAGDGVGTGKVFHYIDGKFDYHQRVYRISNFRPDVLGKYFYYQFSKNFLARIESLTAKSSVDSVRMETIAGMDVAIPPRDEQQRIVIALDDIESLTNSLSGLIAKKEDIKQGMMQQLLSGRSRLHGFTSEWTSGPLGRFMPLQRGFDLPSSELVPGNYPVVYSNGVSQTHAKAMVKGPGVVTGRSGTIGKVHYVVSDYWPHNTALWVTSFARTDARFVYHFLTYLGLERFASGSGVPTFNRNDAHGFEIRLPSQLEEQTAIADALGAVDDEILALKVRKEKTIAIKQGMMQELLTGRTRLQPAEVAA